MHDITKYHEGDVVRVTVEGPVRVESDYTIWVQGRAFDTAKGCYKIEVLERADNPANDPVGAWRRLFRRLYFKRGENEWLTLGIQGSYSDSTLAAVHTERVSVAVSPAVSDPEPDHSKAFAGYGRSVFPLTEVVE